MIANRESGGNGGSDQAEINLVVAVIVQAFKDIHTRKRYKHPDRRKRRELDKQMAIRWLESESKGPMSFIWYCNLLGLDHEWIRSKAQDKKPLCPSIRRTKLTS